MTRWSRPSRRTVLRHGALFGSAALAGCAPFPEETLRKDARLFRLGVASGDPLPDAVVIWTRLAPDPLNGGGMPDRPVEVAWEVSEDDLFRRIARRGTAVARPDSAHVVHVDVRGLKPGRDYWYRFRVGRQSATGRTRTAPVRSDVFRFAVASCQNYEHGYYTAYRHMAMEDLDLVVHLGDYIYEDAARDGRPRRHNGPKLKTLADYRNRYALYRLDPDLRAAHAAFPWALVGDDHEVENDYAGSRDTGAGALKRRAAAYKAYFEHMPLRTGARPTGARMQLYRRLAFGNLLTLNLLDTRQYRTGQPCGNGWKVPCEASLSPDATMLGTTQEHWLERGLAESRTAWNILAQQVPMMQRRRIRKGVVQLHMDKWDGYQAARQRLFDAIERHRPSGLVVLSGDVHETWVGDLKRDFGDPTSPVIGSEFVGTSISSRGDGWDTRPRYERMLAANPHIRYFNGHRGYMRCTVMPERWRTDLRTVPYVSRPGAPVETKASFVIDRGRAGMRKL